MINHNIQRNISRVKDLDRITIGTQYEFIGSDVADFIITFNNDMIPVELSILKTDGTLYEHYGKNFTIVYKNQESLDKEE